MIKMSYFQEKKYQKKIPHNISIGLGGQIIGIEEKIKKLDFFRRGLKILILELLKMHFIIFRANHRKDTDMITSKQIKDK